ncbi:MAG TPA: hypothetical protein VF635_07625 [Propionibacteriaceae bacterium]|jgi:cytoskeletal protein RodZ
MPRRTDLDGPALTYGGPTGAPVRQRRGVPTSTWVLLGVCLLLAVLLVASIQRGRTAMEQFQTPSASPPAASATAAAPASSPTAATPSASAAESSSPATVQVPPQATQVAARFVTAWLEPEAKRRVPALQQVATPGLTEQLRNVDPGRIVKAEPVGPPRPGSVSDGSATLNQRLSNGTTITLDLAMDPGSAYGWLVYAVSPGASG